MKPRSDKQFDVVLWGATGFTGQLVAEYFATNYGVGGQLRWAIAGRNSEKLEKLRKSLETIQPRAASLPILLGECGDLATCEKIASQTKVLCTTVGPYLDYGVPMVQACVEAGTDYCDLSGETPFIRRIIDEFELSAIQGQSKIVPSCGFDSIPSDLGCWMLQEYALEHYGAPCEDVTLYVGKTKGGMSGGTIASMIGLLQRSVTDRSIRRTLGHPYALNPEGTWRGEDGSDQANVRWDSDLGCWTGPFVMAGINTRIVRRTNALLEEKYGSKFSYREVTTYPKGFKSRVRAEIMRFGLGAFVGMVALKPTRTLLEKTILPAPGEGPSAKERNAGYFNFTLIGKGRSPNGESFEVKGSVYGDKDPGYAGTARMLGEAAISLALQRVELPKTYGILTPASAMGTVLLRRLQNAGMEFKVETRL